MFLTKDENPLSLTIDDCSLGLTVYQILIFLVYISASLNH